MLTVLADREIPHLHDYLPSAVHLEQFDAREGLPSDRLEHVDALLVRTVTRVDRHTLVPFPTRLSMVGATSAGYDHIDRPLLEQNGIRFLHAGGCNARAVGEYVASALLYWCACRQERPEKLKAGLIGAGQTGTHTAELLDVIGLQTVAYDPPREQRDPEFHGVSWQELKGCDVLSFHVPLVHPPEGGAPLEAEQQWPTWHLGSGETLAELRPRLVINASRGGVLDEQSAIQFTRSHNADLILDVWENEPAFNDHAAREALLATPHIAGYSRQARLRATQMVCSGLARHFNLDQPDALRMAGTETGDAGETAGDVESLGGRPPQTLRELVHRIHPVCEYDRHLRSLIAMSDTEKHRRFPGKRKALELRNEFKQMSVPAEWLQRHPVLARLGLREAT